MRTLAKILVAVGLALTVSTMASALGNITIAQTGGTYDGVNVVAGDTIILTITASADGGGPETTVTGMFAEIEFGGVATFDGGTETGFSFVNGTPMLPIITGTDIGTVPGFPTLAKGWEATSIGGAPAAPAYSITLGTATFTLNGTAGSIFTSGATLLNMDTGDQFPASSSVAINLIPEPTTASLLGLGLIGLSVAGRNRKN